MFRVDSHSSKKRDEWGARPFIGDAEQISDEPALSCGSRRSDGGRSRVKAAGFALLRRVLGIQLCFDVTVREPELSHVLGFEILEFIAFCHCGKPSVSLRMNERVADIISSATYGANP